MPGVCRRDLHAAGHEGGRAGTACRFRAQRAVPGPRVRQPRRTHQGHYHRLGRPVPDLAPRRDRAGDTGAGAQASELVDGPEDHHRFRINDEQGPRGDRGSAPVRAVRRRDRCAGSSAIHHSQYGRVRRPLGGGPAWCARHAHADRPLPGLA